MGQNTTLLWTKYEALVNHTPPKPTTKGIWNIIYFTLCAMKKKSCNNNTYIYVTQITLPAAHKSSPFWKAGCTTIFFPDTSGP